MARVSDSDAFAPRGDEDAKKTKEQSASALRSRQRKLEAIGRLVKNPDFKVFVKEVFSQANGYDFGTTASSEFIQGAMACCSYIKGIICSAKGGAELIGNITADYFKGITPTISTKE